MGVLLRSIKESLFQLFYPQVCAGCGSDVLTADSEICAKCIHSLPFTYFEKHSSNPVEKNLAGRIRFEKAASFLYFNKEGLVQRLMHQFKYQGNVDLGRQLGVIMGARLLESGRFANIDMLVPLPLFENKQKKRGFNQSTILCKGIQEVINVEIVEDAVERPMFTETQTKKNRIERWKNMDGKFQLVNEERIKNKNVLLVDDVITTGATIESCGSTLLESKGLTLSIATLCCAIKI